jgi:FeS assembly SUF system regulator
MIKIAKLTDYGVALMTCFAQDQCDCAVTARDLAERMGLPQPTVSKLLKTLTRGELLISRRGVRGGYSLARAPEQITLADILQALEGPVTMTECSGEATTGGCYLESSCGVRDNWNWINRKIMESLEDISLLEMSGSLQDTAVGYIPAKK